MTRSISQHIPQRTCVACRRVRPKRELIRLIRAADGSVELDTTGKKAGRGAYLCPGCWPVGIKGTRLEYTLRTSLTPQNREQLIKAMERLQQGVS